MRKQNYKGRCEKRVFKKCKNVCKTYDPIQSAYDVEDYKLTTLCDYYTIRDELFAHRALGDAFATGNLFECLAKDKIDY